MQIIVSVFSAFAFVLNIVPFGLTNCYNLWILLYFPFMIYNHPTFCIDLFLNVVSISFRIIVAKLPMALKFIKFISIFAYLYSSSIIAPLHWCCGLSHRWAIFCFFLLSRLVLVAFNLYPFAHSKILSGFTRQTVNLNQIIRFSSSIYIFLFLFRFIWNDNHIQSACKMGESVKNCTMNYTVWTNTYTTASMPHEFDCVR